MARILFIFVLLVSPGLSEQVNAQDLEPRRWSHLPSGLNIVGVGYVYTQADIFFSPVLKITDGTSRVNSLGLSATYTFDLVGKSARISLLLPYRSGRWEGDVDGEFQRVHRRGMGDPRVRLSVNLYGAPALNATEFAQYRTEHSVNTVIGASIAVTAPFGKYCDTCLINIGNNRWSVRPQIGMVHTRGPWSFELTGSAFVFSDNKDFDFIDNAVLRQKPLYTVQTHAIYNFNSGIWASFSTGYGVGGRIHIDETKTSFKVDNWVIAANLVFPSAKASESSSPGSQDEHRTCRGATQITCC